MSNYGSTGGGRGVDARGDVVVEDAGSVTVERAEDVFVARRACRSGVTVADAEDVHVQADDGDHRDVFRDHVVDDGRDVTLSGVEDVRVHRDAVGGELTVRSAEDVFVADPEEATVRDVEDVFLAAGAVGRRDAVRVERAQDVHVEAGAVAGDLAVRNPEDVMADGDPADRIETQSSVRAGAESVRLRDVEDVHLADDAVAGTAWVDGADAVHTGDDGWSLF